MNKWLIFSKDNCPYCDKAKFALQNESEVEVKNISKSASFKQELLEMNPNARTMPQIFWGMYLLLFKLERRENLYKICMLNQVVILRTNIISLCWSTGRKKQSWLWHPPKEGWI